MNTYLTQKIEKVLKLEMQLDEVKDAYRALEFSYAPDDRKQQSRIQMLERNIEQIGTMYQSVMNEHSLLRVNLNRAERKLTKNDEKISGLEKISQEKTKKIEKITKALLILRE